MGAEVQAARREADGVAAQELPRPGVVGPHADVDQPRLGVVRAASEAVGLSQPPDLAVPAETVVG
jgi:hypothetical protein